MKKNLLVLFIVLVGISISYSQPLLVENFDNPVHVIGTQIDTVNSPWKAFTQGAGDTIAAGLTYSGYPGSGLGNSIQVCGVAGAKIYRNFTPQTSGSVYAFFMVNIKSGDTGGDIFFHFSTNPGDGNNSYAARLSARVNATGDSIGFSIQHGKASTAGTSKIISNIQWLTNKTYILVVKYIINPGPTNDQSALFVLDSASPLPTTEPATPTLGPVSDAGYADLGDATTPGIAQGCGSIMLRQTAKTPNCRLDGFRVATSWAGALSGTGVKSFSNENPTEFALAQNYPNPFNPSTKIPFSLLGSSVVRLKVYNILGKEVITLVNEHKDAGNYEVTFDASNLMSGMYFYRLQTGNFISTKKMALIK